MVVSKFKYRASFAAFVLPAVLLYSIFAIYPLFMGLWISTTNWDGAAPWTPAQIAIEDFETALLPVLKPADRTFLLRYYEKDEEQGTYRNLGILGFDRFKAMGIFRKAGMSSEYFRNVGLTNYRNILTGKIGKSFYPQSGKQFRFKPGDALVDAAEIDTGDFAKNLEPRLVAGDREVFDRFYAPAGDKFVLRDKYRVMDELEMQIALAGIAGLEDDWENLYSEADRLGKENRAEGLTDLVASTPAVAALPAADRELVTATLGDAAALGQIKIILSSKWYKAEFKMGVLLFTGFFVIVNVIAVNLLGLLVALGLDSGIKSGNALRAVFYIPNVLSMVIVAFIWQTIFTQLLPVLTGIGGWMNNPELAPWITVFVATWQGLGYYIVVYHAGLQSVPTELIESASIDGASRFRRFVSITFPLLMPAVTICLFVSLAGALKTFDIIFALYPGTSTPLGIDNIVVNIFYEAFRDKLAGQATAKAVLLMFFIMAVTGVQLVVTKRKEISL